MNDVTRPDLPFLYPEDGAFRPSVMARGFWGPNDNLHARVMIGLFAREFEHLYGEPDLQPARLTVDLYRLPDLSPVTVETRLIRQGGRIKVVEGEMFSSGQSIAKASCQFLRRTQQPEAPVWSRPAWDAPHPDTVPPPEKPFTPRWEMKPVGDNATAEKPRRTWLREIRQLVEGEAYTPFVRIATGIDYTSPITNAGANGLDFINSDVTLYLHRLPVGEWVGYEVMDHQSRDGVAIGQCTLHDVEGPVGFSSCAALAQRRRTA
jgi:hypothetical protein